MEKCHQLLFDKIDLMNLEGHRVMPDISKPLPLGGPPGQVTIQLLFFFNKDLEYLMIGNKERKSALSISKFISKASLITRRMLPNTSLILKLFCEKFKNLICHFTEMITLKLLV
ncbi:hypothetical protein Tco_0794681 [Tanacetum coccineum]